MVLKEEILTEIHVKEQHILIVYNNQYCKPTFNHDFIFSQFTGDNWFVMTNFPTKSYSNQCCLNKQKGLLPRRNVHQDKAPTDLAKNSRT